MVVFAGFSADLLVQRIMDCKPKVVITCNAVKRGPKVLYLKDIVDAAISQSAKNGISIDVCLTYENQSGMTRCDTKWHEGRDIWWQVKGQGIYGFVTLRKSLILTLAFGRVLLMWQN